MSSQDYTTLSEKKAVAVSEQEVSIPTSTLSLYPPEQLIMLWGQEKMTPEQAIGQLLQYVQIYHTRLARLEAAHPELAAWDTPAEPDMGASIPTRMIRKHKR